MKFRELVSNAFHNAYLKFISVETEFKDIRESLKFTKKMSIVEEQQRIYGKKKNQILDKYNRLLLQADKKNQILGKDNVLVMPAEGQLERLELGIELRNTLEDLDNTEILIDELGSSEDKANVMPPMFSVNDIPKGLKLSPIDLSALAPILKDIPDSE